MATKVCNTCHIEKTINDFYPANRGVLGVRGECAVCNKAKKAIYRENNKEKLIELKKINYRKNIKNNLAGKKEYRQANKGRINALVALRKRRIKERTPIWIDTEAKWLIKEAYELAELRTSMHGFSWHVDHIIPLQGNNVSGLHVPNNLQVIPWIDNIRKKNLYEAI